MALDGCPTQEELIRYLERAHERDPRVGDATADHIAECALCQQALDDPADHADTLRWRELWAGGTAGTGRVDGVRSEGVGLRHARGDGSGDALAIAIEIEGYEVLGVLGRGGSGVVYKAWQRKLNRVVALKVLAAGMHASATAVARFRTESEIIAGLKHPNVVAIHDVGEHQGVPYLCLEFLEGGSLADWLRERGEPLEPRIAARVVAALARVVHSAHERGIIHRDLKPANVLLGRSTSDELDPERLKLTDFGLAKRLGADIGEAVSLSGVVLGTPAYMAPEQAGRRKAKVGPAADVYSLGAILYELLTLEAPFRGDSPIEVVLDVVMKSPAPPSRLRQGIPGELGSLCLRCLEKDPAKRPGTAERLAEELERIAACEAAPRRRGRWLVVGSGSASALLITILTVLYYSRPPIARVSPLRSAGVREIEMTLPASSSTFTQGGEYHQSGRIQLSPPVDGLWANEKRITFDLGDDRHKDYLYEAGTENARIWTESRHDIRYWGPIDDRKWFQVVYVFRFNFPVRSATLFASLNRSEAAADGILEVASDPDGEWHRLAMGSTLSPHGGPIDVSDMISGSRVIYVRARMRGRDDGKDSAMAQFLRTSIYPDGNLDIKAPNVFELRAFAREVPIVTAGIRFSDGWSRPLRVASDGLFPIDRVFERAGLHTGTVVARALGVGERSRSFEIWINSPGGKIEVSDREVLIDRGGRYFVGGKLTGSGKGPWDGEVDFGDGSGRQSLPVAANATFQLDHQYQSPGTYHPRITIKNRVGEMWTDFPRCHVISAAVQSGSERSRTVALERK